jgi:hypothetical protein
MSGLEIAASCDSSGDLQENSTHKMNSNPPELGSLQEPLLGGSGDLFFHGTPIHTEMPSFYIQSLFERQLEKLRVRQERVRQELDSFVNVAELLAGQETANVFRAYLDIPWGFRYRGERLPEIPSEGRPFLDDFLKLNRREAALVLKMRNTAFWFRDSPLPPYVLWCYYWYWDNIEVLRQQDDGNLTLPNVQRLLEVLLDREPRFPTPQQVVDLGMDADEVKGWERTFRHKRRHLVWLFQTAVRLGEDVVYSMI